MPKVDRISMRAALAFVFVVGVTSVLQGCGDDSSSSKDDDPGEPHSVSFPLEGALSEVFLPAEQTTNVNMTLRPPVGMGPIKTAEIDVEGSMEHMTVTPLVSKRNIGSLGSVLSGEQAATMLVRVGANPETVCQDGIVYGPYDAMQEVESIELNEGTISVINTGSATVCLEFYSSFDAYLSISELEATITEEECDAPANFAGVWTGTYACGNSCGGGFDGDVTITINQSGSSATYVDDGGDEYEGSVCGNVFTFERIDNDEVERGTLVLDDANHATKQSTWRMQTSPYCTGNCVDQLTRQALR